MAKTKFQGIFEEEMKRQKLLEEIQAREILRQELMNKFPTTLAAVGDLASCYEQPGQAFSLINTLGFLHNPIFHPMTAARIPEAMQVSCDMFTRTLYQLTIEDIIIHWDSFNTLLGVRDQLIIYHGLGEGVVSEINVDELPMNVQEI